MPRRLIAFLILVCLLTPGLVLAFPSSTNYKLRDYGFGGGGQGNMASSNYAIDGIAGEVSAGAQLSGATYKSGTGLLWVNQAAVPPAPTFTNPASYYNKLKIVIDTGGNPSDTKFSIAISADNFSSDTRYVQSDNTVGAVRGTEDYQTYTAWGGASGVLITGLLPSTTYYVKVNAWQGKFTETAFGPTASAATVGAQMTFDIDVSASDTDTDPPFTVAFGNLTAGSVSDSPSKIWVDLDTNAANGGKVYVYAQNGGLSSALAGSTISSSTGNLTALSSGFGAQGSSATQTSGGPLSIVSPYDGASNNVGVTDTTIREIFSAGAAITGGRGSFLLKAKPSATQPAASDYTETLTVIASASF